MSKDLMKLANGVEYEITEEAYNIGHMEHIAADETAAVSVSDAITRENLKHVEFRKDDVPTPYRTYDNLVVDTAPTRSTNKDGTVTVVISLREKNEIEKMAERLAAIEAEQTEQNEAIDFLAME